MTLWLVRHAQPLVAPGVCYGRTDMPADADATRHCAELLAQALPPHTAIMASPLQRCEQLRQSLSGLRRDLVFKTDVRLQEMDFGGWEGRAWAAIDAAELKAWTDDFSAYRCGGTGESVAMFMARVAAAFDALDPALNTCWLTHAGVIRASALLAGGQRHITRASQWPPTAPAFGQWVTLNM